MLRQAQILQMVMDAWHQPRDIALSALYDAYDLLVRLEDRNLGPAGANALLRIGQYVRVFAGRSAVSEGALDRAERWARLHDDAVLLTFVLTQRGAAWDGEAVLGRSLAYFTEALVVARSLHTRQPECSVLSHLGQRLADAGLHAEAASCMNQCLALVADRQTGVWREYARLARGNLSWTSLLAGRHEEALHHIDRWFGLLGPEADVHGPDMREIANAHENRALALLGLGRSGEALDSAQRARDWARRSQSPYVECGADLAMGRALVALGRRDEGFGLIKGALDRSRSEVGRQLQSALLTIATVHEQAEDHEIALVYLHELYLLRQRNQDALVRALDADLGRQLELEPDCQGLVVEPIELARAASRGVAPAARAGISKLNLLLEEHAVAAERLDDDTGVHCYRVGRLAALLGHRIGFDEDTCFLLEISARLHDVGKLMVPDELLMKPGRLSPAERQIVQRHTVAGWEILGRTQVPQVHIAQEIARHHHEWWDGSGYPDGIAGDAIPVSARLSALADVFDALTHVRPYKSAWPVEEALSEIRSLRGIQFDPDLTDVFVAMVEQLQAQHPDLDAWLGEAAGRSGFVEARERVARLLKGSDPSVSAFSLDRLLPTGR